MDAHGESLEHVQRSLCLVHLDGVSAAKVNTHES